MRMITVGDLRFSRRHCRESSAGVVYTLYVYVRSHASLWSKNCEFKPSLDEVDNRKVLGEISNTNGTLTLLLPHFLSFIHSCTLALTLKRAE
jgi:hypothetical protein